LVKVTARPANPFINYCRFDRRVDLAHNRAISKDIRVKLPTFFIFVNMSNMIEALQQQYELARSTRGIVFNFLTVQVGDDLNSPIPAFDNKTIRELLEHTAYCYYNWLAGFARQRPPLAGRNDTTLDDLKQLYSLVDDTVATFLETFHGKMESPIAGVHDGMGQLSATPLAVFTHVLTHEFHHKGQIMAMCRLLGYPPPDTDVSNFFF